MSDKALSDKAHVYHSLFTLAKSLFLQQTTGEVLRKVAQALNDHFPFAVSRLYMSHDIPPTDPPIMPLVFRRDENELCMRAFMEGKTVLDAPADAGGGRSAPALASAAPLRGKQGVYGVLELRANERPLTPSDVEFLDLIGETAGFAFENAKLHEQSNLLVTELRLMNEMTKRLNQSLRVSEIFQYVCQQCIELFRADFAFILERDLQKNKFVIQATNVETMMSGPQEVDCGFAGLLHQTKEPLIVSDYGQNDRIDSKLMRETGSRSLIAAPILINDEAAGAVLVMHAEPHYFTYENYKLLNMLAGHIGLAIMKARFHAELNRMVITDNLTGLYARKYLDDQVHARQAKDACGSLIVIDIDNFKQVNDTYGHQIGDKILKQVSAIIRSCIRDTDIAARWGGEELAVYLPQLSLEQTERIAERICRRIEAETRPGVTVSCGIAEWTRNDPRISVETLFYKADMALYEAKHSGKNQYRIG